MAERTSWAVSAPAGVITVEDARVAFGALAAPSTSAVRAKTGFRPGSGTSPGLVSASGTPDANVSVAPFQLLMQTSRAAIVGGPYIATLDAAKTINVLSTPAHGTLARNDLIVAQQSDMFYGDGSNAFVVRHVVGTPHASPSDPAVSGSADYITLARVRVDAAATTITAAKVTDLRPAALWTVALGGVLPVPSQAVRDALTGAYDGFTVWRQDRKWLEVYDGTGWRVQGTATVTSVADLSAITHPYTGQLASDGAAGVLHRYTGAAWTILKGKPADGHIVTTGGVTLNSTSYLNLGTLTAPFTKHHASTGVLVTMMGSAFVATATAVLTAGVRFGSTDYDVTGHFFNQALDHRGWSGTKRLPGIAAGVYTAQARGKTDNAARPISFDSGDQVSMTIEEVP